MTGTAENVVIRRATPDDANLIAVLGAVTFYEAYFEQDDPRALVDYIAEAFEPEKVRGEVESPAAEFFIAYLNGKAVGYAKLREDSRVECVDAENSVELQRIYIVERAFGRGVGETLLSHCLQAARQKGFETLWLSVWKENGRAIRFYEKHGFVPVGMHSFLFGVEEATNFVMQKSL